MDNNDSGDDNGGNCDTHNDENNDDIHKDEIAGMIKGKNNHDVAPRTSPTSAFTNIKRNMLCDCQVR